MRSKLTVLLSEAPTVEIDENDDVHIRDEGTDASVDRVMSIHSLMVYVRRGDKALVDWQVKNGPLPAME
ncbi:MAG TPA: hypothetical protein VE053_06845 [Allosphingosinicella sp.]|nr:hypothetical protein [Allosphingosinicella sp.]